MTELLPLRGMPRPAPDADTAPFWDGCARREFLIQRCSACATTRWPPGPVCPRCQSAEAEWTKATLTGTIYSWIVVHRAAHAVLKSQVPYVAVLVDLDDGVRVLGNLLGDDSEEIEAGSTVEITFQEIEDGRYLPNFRRAPRSAKRPARTRHS